MSRRHRACSIRCRLVSRAQHLPTSSSISQLHPSPRLLTIMASSSSSNTNKLYALNKSHPFGKHTHGATIHDLQGDRLLIPGGFVNPLLPAAVIDSRSATSAVNAGPSSSLRTRGSSQVVTPPRNRLQSSPLSPGLPSRILSTEQINEIVGSPRPLPAHDAGSPSSAQVPSSPSSNRQNASPPTTPVHLKRQCRIIPASDFGSLTYDTVEAMEEDGSLASSSSNKPWFPPSPASTLVNLEGEAEKRDLSQGSYHSSKKSGKGHRFLGKLGSSIKSRFEIEEFTLEDHLRMMDECRKLGLL